MLHVLEFEILRDLEANGARVYPLPRKPVRVATLLDEADFRQDQILRHNQNVFLEDRVHDWLWQDGKFQYYTRVKARADVLIVYRQEDTRSPQRATEDGARGRRSSGMG